MAEFALNDVQIYFGGFNYSTYVSGLQMNYGAELIDVTTFNDGARSRVPGFETFDGSIEGFLDDTTAFAVDEEIESRHGGTAEPMSVVFGTGAVGQQAYLASNVFGSYNFGGAVGEAGVYTVEFANQGAGSRLVTGEVMASGQYTSTQDESNSQIGAIDNTTSGEIGYAALHVVSWDGTTTSVDVEIESDDSGAFSTPTSRITFATLNDVGSEFKTLESDVTDDYWRASITLAGAAPDVTLFVTFGIK
jgi:VCBS repeat-containing protein